MPAYHAEVKTYAETISSVVNYFIRKLLGLSYPQPHVADITISKQPVPDFSNFVVVYRKVVL